MCFMFKVLQNQGSNADVNRFDFLLEHPAGRGEKATVYN